MRPELNLGLGLSLILLGWLIFLSPDSIWNSLLPKYFIIALWFVVGSMNIAIWRKKENEKKIESVIKND